jgi:hypothetical protein
VATQATACTGKLDATFMPALLVGRGAAWELSYLGDMRSLTYLEGDRLVGYIPVGFQNSHRVWIIAQLNSLTRLLAVSPLA